MKISVICGMCKGRGIGANGTLPWHFKQDLRFFQRITIGNKYQHNGILMGRKTWESLPFKPLPYRESFVVSQTMGYSSYVYKDIYNAIHTAKGRGVDNLFIIGGETIYREVIKHQIPNYIYLTEIDKYFECDTFFPKIPTDVYHEISRVVKHEKDTKLTFKMYKNMVNPEVLNIHNFKECVE